MRRSGLDRSGHAGARPASVGRDDGDGHDLPMDILLVLILIAVLGLFAQAVGTDSRGFSGRAA